jgi:hypothetical protein
MAASRPVWLIPCVDFPHAIAHTHHSIQEVRDIHWWVGYEEIPLGDRGKYDGEAAERVR